MISITECSACKSKNIKVGRMVRPGWLWVWVVASVGGVLAVCPVEVACKDCGTKMAAQELPPPLWSVLGIGANIFNWHTSAATPSVPGTHPIKPV